MSLRALLFSLVLAVSWLTVARAETLLVMVEEQGCLWCDRWNNEIGPIYPKTNIGKAAPIRRIDKNAPRPTDMTFSAPLRFTPTFILMIDGVEASRLEGYPGEDFFWGLIEKMLQRANIDVTG